MDEAVGAYARAVAETLGAALGGDLFGLYLPVRRRSATTAPIVAMSTSSPCARHRIDVGRPGDTLAARLAADALPCPAAGGLEFSLITRSEATNPVTPRRMSCTAGTRRAVSMPDHRAEATPTCRCTSLAVRAGGVVMLGPGPSGVFREVARGELLFSACGRAQLGGSTRQPELPGALGLSGPARPRRGRICSKREAAEWVLERGDSPPPVAAVLHHHTAATIPAGGLEPASVAAFVATVRARLLAETSSDSRPRGRLALMSETERRQGPLGRREFDDTRDAARRTRLANEEMVTEIFRAYVRSYKDLPLNLYHIQWKFRDEVRPRFGLMRGREFLMKDAYSFDLDQAGARHSYNKMFVAYLRTFARLGLKSIPMRADTGPIGGDLSHEFIILASTGETRCSATRTIWISRCPAPT